MRVRLRTNSILFINGIKNKFIEGWNEVDEKQLKELRKLGVVIQDSLQIEHKNDTPILEPKRRGRPKLVHATE